MARKGYAHEKGIRDTITRLLPEDYTPVRWIDLWLKAKREDVRSRTTFQKYLLQLMHSGRIIKEGRMYRRNPTYGVKLAEDLRKNAGMDTWSTRMYLTFRGQNAESTVDKYLRDLIAFSFSMTLTYYVDALKMIAKAPNEKAAHEIMNLFLQSETFQLVMTARQVYEFRKKANFERLQKDQKFMSLLDGMSQPFGIEGLFAGRREVPNSKVSRF